MRRHLVWTEASHRAILNCVREICGADLASISYKSYPGDFFDYVQKLMNVTFIDHRARASVQGALFAFQHRAFQRHTQDPNTFWGLTVASPPS